MLAERQGSLTAEDINSAGGMDGLLEGYLESQLESAKLQGLDQAAIQTLLAMTDRETGRRAGRLNLDEIMARQSQPTQRLRLNRALSWLCSADVRLAAVGVHRDLSITLLNAKEGVSNTQDSSLEKDPVNHRVGLFVRVPKRIGAAHRPVNRRTNDAESHANDGSCVANPTVALIPEELLNLSGPMIGAENGVAGAVAC